MPRNRLGCCFIRYRFPSCARDSESVAPLRDEAGVHLALREGKANNGCESVLSQDYKK